jgi:hypothetical protein
MTDRYYLAKSNEIDKRKLIAEEFYSSILESEEIPYIVTDDACLYDFYAGIDEELISKVKTKYLVDMKPEHFKIPFWQFLDWLQINRKY